VAIGRGATGNPWLYFQAERALDNLPPLPEPSPEERLRVILRHYQLIWDEYEPRTSSHVMRKHLVGYMRGLPGHKAVKEALFEAAELTPQLLTDKLSAYFEALTRGDFLTSHAA
jgi:tRNA-dihydrouridine synthase B